MTKRREEQKKEQAETVDARLGEVLEFMRLLWKLDHQLQSTSKRMKVRLGVTGPQRLCLRIVGAVPGIAAGELATILHVHPSTLTGVLRRLEKQGLLTRKPDPNDMRRSLFDLTAAGKLVDATRSGTVEGAVRAALSKLPEGAVASTREVLVALSDSLDRLG